MRSFFSTPQKKGGYINKVQDGKYPYTVHGGARRLMTSATLRTTFCTHTNTTVAINTETIAAMAMVSAIPKVGKANWQIKHLSGLCPLA